MKQDKQNKKHYRSHVCSVYRLHETDVLAVSGTPTPTDMDNVGHIPDSWKSKVQGD